MLTIYRMVNYKVMTRKTTTIKQDKDMGNDGLKDNQYLGSLCKRGHDFNGTGLSIRYRPRGGPKKGGVCIVCNIAYNKKKEQEAKKNKARRNEENRIIAKCPMCEEFHEYHFEGGWIGNGMPRKFCPACQTKRDDLENGAIDYGYSA